MPFPTKEQRNAYLKEWRKRPGKKEAIRARDLMRNYGLTPADWDVLWTAQNGLCPLCVTPLARGRYMDDSAHVDHDHSMERPDGTCPKEAVRGLLCSVCNRMLGLAKDNPDTLLRARDWVTKPLR